MKQKALKAEVVIFHEKTFKFVILISLRNLWTIFVSKLEAQIAKEL